MKFFIFIFIVFALTGEGVCFCNTSCYVKKQLNCIPKEERIFLERFFHELVRTDGLGYVLFGSKPMCLSGYFTSIPFCDLLFIKNDPYFRRGWEIWKKYEKKFPHPLYFIFEEMHVVENKTIHCLFFVSKKNLIAVLNDNLSIFEKELHQTFSIKSIISEIDQKQSIYHTIKHHEGLLGILLGYGKKSSMQYYRRDLSLNGRLPVVFKDNLLLTSLHLHSDLDYIYPMSFVGNPQSEEVKVILKTNQKERYLLQEIYTKNDFLVTTLMKLMEL